MILQLPPQQMEDILKSSQSLRHPFAAHIKELAQVSRACSSAVYDLLLLLSLPLCPERISARICPSNYGKIDQLKFLHFLSSTIKALT